MTNTRVYQLPELSYGYDQLSPYISREQLEIHHTKHHNAYVKAANKLIEDMDLSRSKGAGINIKSVCKELSFQLSGHILHSLFWRNLIPPSENKNKPQKSFEEIITKDFGSFDNFKKEFSAAAGSVEGSGWAALVYCQETKRLIILQIEKHNVNLVASMIFYWLLMSGNMLITSIIKMIVISILRLFGI